jgi:hypothetical protein
MPYVGQIVHIYSANPNNQFNGAGRGPYAAIVTRVWSESCINCYVIPDASYPYHLASLCRQLTGEEYNYWEPIKKDK